MVVSMPQEERGDFPAAGSRARAIKRFERDLQAWLSTAEVVFDEVSCRMPGVSLPTVYATLELLEGIGLIHRVASERGAVIYDPRTDAHHHLVCRRCGAIVDVDAPVEAAALLSAARSAGFAPDHAQVVVRGLCADCASG